MRYRITARNFPEKSIVVSNIFEATKLRSVGKTLNTTIFGKFRNFDDDYEEYRTLESYLKNSTLLN